MNARLALVRLKTALVTGAGRRLGRGFALALGRMGYFVAVHHRHSAAEAAETLALVREAGGSGALIEADLADRAALQGLWAAASAEAGGPIGLLVNNASIFEPDGLEDMSLPLYDAHFAVHLTAPLILAQALAAHLPANARGDVVNVLDQRVMKPNPLFFSYSLSKFALHAATTTMAQALAPRIRVNAIAPGPTLPNARQSPMDFVRQTAGTLLGVGPSVEEIAAALRFFLAVDAVTGQTLTLDGGQSLQWRTPDLAGQVE